jgi:uncharacterized membrane protein
MTLQQLFLPAWLARAVGGVLFFGSVLVFPGGANAELKLCNGTGSRVGVAIGYKDRDGWVSEGWWNVDSQSCTPLIQDKLKARFYYVFAFDYDKGGEWGGTIKMCTLDSEFTIKGIDNCDGRGFKKSGFFEVDTQEQTDWTVKLTDLSEPAPVAENASPAAQTQVPSQAAVAAMPGARRR